MYKTCILFRYATKENYLHEIFVYFHKKLDVAKIGIPLSKRA